MTQPERIADVMGGSATLGTAIQSDRQLEAVIADGLPKQALRLTLGRAFASPKAARSMLHRVVPEATFKRRTRLTPAQSERTERLARVIAAAEFVWDNKPDAKEWLSRPHMMLEQRSPIEVAMTEVGARRVEDILNGIIYGLPV